MLRIILGFVVFAIIHDAVYPGLFLSIEGRIGLWLIALPITAWEAYSFWHFHNEQFLELKNGIKITPQIVTI